LSQLYGMGMSHRALEGGGCLGSKPTVEDSKPFLLYEHDVTDYSLTLNWQTVRRADFYELQMRPGEGEWRSIFNGTGNFARKKNLSPGSEYEFRMRYSSNGNFSEFTEPLLLRTLTTELSVTRMSMPSADAIDGTTMRILWNKPARTIKSELQMKQEDGGAWITISDKLPGSIARKKGLKAGHGYLFRTRGYNRDTETWSAYSEPTEISYTKSLHPVFRDLFPEQLTNAEGEKVSLDHLAGKVVGIYFSAHWCPPCRQFTPMLADFYKRVKGEGKKFEIVFVSQDMDNYAFRGYLDQMPWLAVPYRDARARANLGSRFGMRGIPMLKILSPHGEVVCQDGVREALSPDLISRWERM